MQNTEQPQLPLSARAAGGSRCLPGGAEHLGVRDLISRTLHLHACFWDVPIINSIELSVQPLWGRSPATLFRPEIKDLPFFSGNGSNAKELCLKWSLGWCDYVNDNLVETHTHTYTHCVEVITRDKIILVLSRKCSVKTKQFQMLGNLPLNLTLPQYKSIGRALEAACILRVSWTRPS